MDINSSKNDSNSISDNSNSSSSSSSNDDGSNNDNRCVPRYLVPDDLSPNIVYRLISLTVSSLLVTIDNLLLYIDDSSDSSSSITINNIIDQSIESFVRCFE